MKSICIIVQGIYDIDPRVRRKAEALAGAGYSVDVLALRSSDNAKSYNVHGVNIRTIALGKKRGSIVRYMFEYATFFGWVFFRVPLQMLRRRYAVIDVNSLPDFLVFAAILGRWMGAKLVLDLHEITPEFYMSKYRATQGSLTIRVLTWLEKISVRFADWVITINDPIEDLLVSRGLDRAKSTVVMNAADEARFEAKGKALAIAPQDTGKFVMTYHGTLTHIYGLDIAIEALALASKEMPEAELWILGAGPERDALAALAERRNIAPKVRLIGQVPAGEIPSWLKQCDVGILPIRRDVFLDFAFPNKLPEFIITGTPVIISRLKAIHRYFTDDALTFFEPNDAADLAKQMVRVYRDPNLRARQTVSAREEYAPIRWEVMKQRYLKMIGALIAGKFAIAQQPASAEGVNQ